MTFSLIVSTKGRTKELVCLFQSLRDQTFQDFELIVSDQNSDDRLVPLIEESELGGKIVRVESDGGLSRGRNEGLKRVSGEILGFPDDDCAYPSTLLGDVAAFFRDNPNYGFLSGKSFADDGRDSVSRHAKHASEIKKLTIHSQCIEFAVFIRRSRLANLSFDENMGVGAASPWHSDEGPDLLLRLQNAGVHGFYDPRFGVWHARPVTDYSAKSIDRTYRYACGNGHFYRKHRYPVWYVTYQMGRTFLGMLLGLMSLNSGKARLYFARIRGRWRGWTTTSS